MDDVILRRLDCLSKKQLLAAIMAITDKQSSDSAVVTSLAQYLDTIPASVGSSRPLTASTSTTSSNPEVKIEKSVKEQGNFDISKYRTRQIALQVQYDGTAYLGFASQDLEETVENHLFNALLKLKLIEDRKTCRYSRCGRTDKGVSALGQVIALNVRSAIPKDLPESSLKLLSHPADKLVVAVPEAAVSAEVSGDSSKEAVEPLSKKSKKQKNNSSATTPTTTPKEKVVQEMDYVTMLNRALPDDIRVLGWTPVTEEFSARFSASHRTYRYFFQRKHLNIAAMRAAAELLLGSHDFRNICKLDIANVSNFVRDIYAVEIRPFQTCDVPETEETVYMLQITGIAFLWHMVRCIMAVLFMVGEGLEQPDVVNRLLDIDTCVGKPPYALAAEQPLVLHDCGFDNLQIPVQARHMWQLTAHYKNIQEYHLIAAARARNSLEFVLNSQVRQSDLSLFQEDLRLQEERHSKKAQKRNTTSTVLLETGTTTTSATSTDSVENNNTTTSNLKRKYVASSVEPPQQKDDIIDKDSECMVVWSSALQQIENTMGLAPKLKYIPHVPLMERKREDSYEKKIEQLAGSKKERLDRHISLSASAAATGATPEFFTKMRQQGSLV